MTNEELFLAKDYEALYKQNERFMHHICRKYLNLRIPYDDLIGCADLAFMKAINNFVPTQAKWLTYFSKLINNEILMLNRQENKWNKLISLQEVINKDAYGHEFTLEETIYIKEPYLDKDYLFEIGQAVEELTEVQKIVLKFTLEGKTQKFIGKTLRLSQPQISRILQTTRRQLKDKYLKEA